MNTPRNLTDSKSLNAAKTWAARHQGIILLFLTSLALVLALAIVNTFNGASRNQTAETEVNVPAIIYSDALAMQYAQPWLDAQNRTAVPYSNALEMQYAQPWLDAQNKTVVPYSDALAMQYAQPWLDAQNRTAVPYSNALEMQYAQPWLNAQKSLDCYGRLDLFYACQNGLKP